MSSNIWNSQQPINFLLSVVDFSEGEQSPLVLWSTISIAKTPQSAVKARLEDIQEAMKSMGVRIGVADLELVIEEVTTIDRLHLSNIQCFADSDIPRYIWYCPQCLSEYALHRNPDHNISLPIHCENCARNGRLQKLSCSGGKDNQT